MSGYQRIIAYCLLSFAVGCQADGGFKNPFSRASRETADTRDSGMKLPEFKRRKADDLKTLDREKPLIATEQLDRLLQEGQTALQQRELEQAKTSYEKVLEYEPDNATAHHGLAMTADLEERYADAELHYKKALHVRPRDANLLSDIGYSYILQNRFKEAAEYLNLAIEVNPQHEYAHLNLALLDLKQGKKSAAEQRLVQLYGQGGQVIQTLAQLQEQAGLPVDPALSSGSLIAGGSELPPNASFEQAQELAKRRREEAERTRQFQGIPNGMPNTVANAPSASQQQPVIPAGYPQSPGESSAPIQVAPGQQWPSAQQQGPGPSGVAASGMPALNNNINTQSAISIQPGFFGVPGAGSGMPAAGVPGMTNSAQVPTDAGMAPGQPAPSAAPSWPGSFSMPTTQNAPANGAAGSTSAPAQWPPSNIAGATAQVAPPSNVPGPVTTAMTPNPGMNVPGVNAAAMNNAGMPAGWTTAPATAQNNSMIPGANPASANQPNGLVPIHSTGAFSQPAAPVSYGGQGVSATPNIGGSAPNGQSGGLRLEGLNVGPGSLFPVGMGSQPGPNAAPGAPMPGAPANYGSVPNQGQGMVAPGTAQNGMGVNMGNVTSPGSSSMLNGSMYATPASVLPAQEWMNQMNAAKAAAAGQGSGAGNNAPGVSAPWPAARPAAPTGLDAYDRQRQQLDQQYNSTLQQMNRQFPSSTQAKY